MFLLFLLFAAISVGLLPLVVRDLARHRKITRHQQSLLRWGIGKE